MIRLSVALLITSTAVSDETNPTAYFAGDRSSIADRIAEQCNVDHMDVDRRDDRDVVCSRPVQGVKGAWLKFGPNHGSYDTASRQRITFTIRTMGGALQVQARRDIGSGYKHQPWDTNSSNAATALMRRAGGAQQQDMVGGGSEYEIRTTGPIVIRTTPAKP